MFTKSSQYYIKLGGLIIALLSASLFASLVHAYDNTPKGFSKLCDDDEVCSLIEPSIVAYGANGLYVYKVLQGTFVCNIHTFQLDPAPLAKYKTCSYPKPGKPAKTSTVTAAKPSPSNSQGEVLTFLNDTTSIPNGRYAIVSRISGKALEVKDASLDDGAIIAQNAYSGKAHQQWDVTNLGGGYFSIRAVHSGKSLDVFEWSTNDGAKVHQLKWLDSWNQHWRIQNLGGTNFSILSRFSDKSLDAYELATSNRNDIRIWTYWGGDNQQWMFAPIHENTGKETRLKGKKGALTL